MDVLKNKTWEKLWIMDDEYNEYLNVFLHHAFVTSAFGDKMKFSKTLLEKTSMVMLKPLALGSKFLIQLLKGSL